MSKGMFIPSHKLGIAHSLKGSEILATKHIYVGHFHSYALILTTRCNIYFPWNLLSSNSIFLAVGS